MMWRGCPIARPLAAPLSRVTAQVGALWGKLSASTFALTECAR